MAQSTGMFPRKSFLVDAATIMANGVALDVSTKSAGVRIGVYFNATAAGSVAVKDQNGDVVATIAAVASSRAIIEKGNYETYDITSLVLDEANLSAGACQVSLY